MDRLPKPPSAKKLAKEREARKSNLELFKEELKMLQKEREERHAAKHQPQAVAETSQPSHPVVEELKVTGSFDTGDPNTTNIYLGNINPKMTEQQLMDAFGKYGPLASVKIMWPRTDEERARNRNCGFVAFMCRKDAERALKYLNTKPIMGYEMKLGWGKAVPIPPYPVYIPPRLLELTKPPPQSGLPFNAQPAPEDVEKAKNIQISPDTINDPEVQGIIERASVKVTMPSDRNLLSLIHRMVEFVVNEGPLFEAMIMSRELHNPNFRFLFDFNSPAHVYYRWRLFATLQGDQPNVWSTKEFRMFEKGSIWKPPPLNLFLRGMPDELIDDLIEPEVENIPTTCKFPVSSGRDRVKNSSKRDSSSSPRGFRECKESSNKKGTLTESQRDKLEDILRSLTPERQKIADAMIYAVEHAKAAEEVAECIAESLTLSETPLYKKLSRFYLVSDILHNCVVKVANASLYRRAFQSRLESIVNGLREAFNMIDGRIKAEHFKQRIMCVFRAWEEWAIYSGDFMVTLQNIFLGLVSKQVDGTDVKRIKMIDSSHEEDVDGVPLSDEEDDDVDGVPMTTSKDDVSQLPPSPVSNCRLSKWETVESVPAKE